MPRAVVYCRVSTQEQTKNLSLSTQQRLCEDYCRREGFDVDRIFIEAGESAKTADRTELKKLIAYCREMKRRIDFVVVHSLSRFARETRTHHALTGLLAGFGIALRSASERIDGTPAGRLMESIFSSLAQFDNDVKAERTVTGMREALSLGRWTFQAPIGYLTGPEGGPSLIRDSVRGDLVLEAFTEFASGRLHKGELVRRLAQKGLQTRRGRPLSPQRLGDLLRNHESVARQLLEVKAEVLADLRRVTDRLTFPPPTAPCLDCNRRTFWRRAHGHWLCDTCHPAPYELAVAERREVAAPLDEGAGSLSLPQEVLAALARLRWDPVDQTRPRMDMKQGAPPDRGGAGEPPSTKQRREGSELCD